MPGRKTSDYVAPAEALVTWARVRQLLAIYYAAGMAGFSASSTWRQELGVRIDGGLLDAYALLREVVSADAALMALRKCNVRAYNLAMGDIEEPERSWFNVRHTGKGDLMNLTRAEAKDLFERAKGCVHLQMEGGCVGCPFG